MSTQWLQGEYRVALPVDFGDGVVHQPGEIVALDASKAKEYAHALRVVEVEVKG